MLKDIAKILCQLIVYKSKFLSINVLRESPCSLIFYKIKPLIKFTIVAFVKIWKNCFFLQNMTLKVT